MMRSRTKPYKLLIVDDHPIVRHGLCGLISDEPELTVCGEASNSAEALKVVKTKHPDIAVIDISLDNRDNGIALVSMLSREYPNLKTLVASLYEEATYAPRALQAGAMGYVSKRESIRTILDAVYHVLRNGIYVSPRMNDSLLRKAASGVPLSQSPLTQLTRRELQVFELIGCGTTIRLIARKLGVGPKTVETHRRNIRIKLEMKNSMQLNHAAFQWLRDHPG